MDNQNAEVHNADFCKTEASVLSILCVVLLYFQRKYDGDPHCTKAREAVLQLLWLNTAFCH